ncbi:MAG: lipoyl(octanoyl) transferase LipB [Alistipes sp.]|nr:lipoyl(octanoyl) transferase LipB [Alistipes sp.]
MKALCRDLGEMDYAACWDLQRTLFEELTAAKKGAGGLNAGTASNEPSPRDGDADKIGTVLLVEHPPVYTLGKSGHAENLLVDRMALERLGAQFFHIDRGGDITFHGPGQLVCYPVLDLERIGIGLREYIDRLEETVIRTVARYGIAAGRIAGASGVWIGGPEETAADKECAEETAGRRAAANREKDVPRKICAIGVRSSRYVTMHGFALNVTTDLEWFSRINPCGFRDRDVTSIARETGRRVAMEEVKRLVVQELERQLGIEIGSEFSDRSLRAR